MDEVLMDEVLTVVVQGAHWSAIVGALATTAAVLVALFFPMFIDHRRRKKAAVFIREQISLYVDTLLNKIKPWIKNPLGTGKFEENNKSNFDALEYLFRSSDVLKEKERDELLEFILYFKTAPEIRHACPEDGEEYKGKLDSLSRLFKP